jgi:hypothetical protein
MIEIVALRGSGKEAIVAQCGCANLDKPLENAAISSLVMPADIH